MEIALMEYACEMRNDGYAVSMEMFRTKALVVVQQEHNGL